MGVRAEKDDDIGVGYIILKVGGFGRKVKKNVRSGCGEVNLKGRG